MVLSHLLATAAKNFIKHRVDRTRPRSTGSGKGHGIKPGRSHAKEETSFPSGHSAGAAAVARAFARAYPEHRGAALAGAGFIALAQIPRCAHYPTDVGAGLAIGLAAEKAVDLLWPYRAAAFASSIASLASSQRASAAARAAAASAWRFISSLIASAASSGAAEAGSNMARSSAVLRASSRAMSCSAA